MKSVNQIRSFSFFLLICITAACSPHYKIISSKSHQYPISKNQPLDSSVLAFYTPYKKLIDSQMNVVVAQSHAEIKRGKPEGQLNNLIADAIAFAAQKDNIEFDFVHINYKALRVPLPSGQIKAYKIFELLPYENLLVTVKLSGSDINELFHYIAKSGGDPISGATLSIRNTLPFDIKIKGQPFDPQKAYTVLTNDFFANGGDGALFYNNAIERKSTHLKQRDVFFEYLKLKEGTVLEPNLDGRILSDKPVSDE